MARMVWLAVCLALGACAGCGGQQQSAPRAAAPKPAVKPVPPTPIDKAKAELDEQTWNPAWSRLIEKSLPRNLLSRKRARQVRALCPRFGHLSKTNRRVFWAYFFQALAGAEAGLKPTADVRHAEPAVAVIDTVTHRMVRSEGLLQLTYMDGKRYGCNFDWQRDKLLPEHDPAKTILQPKNNLLCGINILDDQLVTHHEPLLSPRSYWSTLRPGTLGYRVFIRQMANEPEFCLSRRERQRRERMRREAPAASATMETAASH
ncbi:MAG: hypothetical protein ACRD27_03890 [Terracidiphilus sp.]